MSNVRKNTERLQAWVESNPEDAPEYLAAISVGLARYRERVEKKREGAAYNALSDLQLLRMHPKMGGPTEKAVMLLNAVYYLLPEGTPNSGVTQAIWEEFLQACRADNAAGAGFERKWMEETRGWACADWFDKYVIPRGVVWKEPRK